MMSQQNRFQAIDRTAEFERDFKKLVKRFKTLGDDLDNLIKYQLVPFHKLNQNNGGTLPISGLGNLVCQVYKTKKFACKSLKGKGAKTGLRLIHAYFQSENRIELIEIYYKGDKENEDRDRILQRYHEGNG